ncbi:MAG: YceD family protein [Ilumatobacteraceae bacterium]|jgi:uncharacterized protein
MAISPELRPLRVNMVELLRQPGAERSSSASVDPDVLGCIVAEGQASLRGPIEVAIHAVSGTDEVEVDCVIEAAWIGDCRRCLAPVSGVETIRVVEHFRPAVASRDAGQRDDADVIAVEGDQIDLVPTVRETVMIELPMAPLCSPDCAGICPICGTDRNSVPCGCSVEIRDERWAALDSLRLDE